MFSDDPYLENGETLITLPDTFYVFPLTIWNEWIGEAHLSSYAPGIVKISSQPDLSTDDDVYNLLNNGVSLVNYDLAEIVEGTLQLSLWWRAETTIPVDYSVFVHLSRVEQPESEADILAQFDSAAPVYGWYPTSRWSVGELVRDDYVITLPDGYEGPLFIRVGMYHQLGNGSFENFESLVLPIE